MKIAPPLWLGLLVGGAVASGAPARAAPMPTAIVMVTSGGASGEDVQVVEAGVRGGLGALAIVQPHDDTTTQMDDARTMGLTCDLHVAECAARFGAIAGVAEVLLVDVAIVAGQLHIGMTRVDVNIGGAMSAFVATAAPTPESEVGAIASAVGAAVKRLYQAAGALGRARFTGVPPSAVVLVDGTIRGTSPLPWPIDGLTPGAHEAVLTQDGAPVRRIAFSIEPGEARVVAVPGASGASAGPKTAAVPASTSSASAASPDFAGTSASPAGDGELSPLVIAGSVTVGAGALVALGAGVTAGAVEATLATPMAYADRQSARTLGAVMLVSIGIGAAGAVVGGTLIAVGATP